jgi:dGTPase
MIYIVYGLSGPLKRVLIDPIFEEGYGNPLNITFNKRGVWGKKLADYDDSKKELIFCEKEADLKTNCDSDYIYDYHGYRMAINNKEIKDKYNKDDEHHIIICHDLTMIKKIKQDYPNIQIIKISFSAVSNILELACKVFEFGKDEKANQKVLYERAKTIGDIIEKIESDQEIKHDIEIVEKRFLSDYDSIGKNLRESLCDKLNSQWHNLLNSRRFNEEGQDDYMAFEQDYNRIINIAAFRRLQDKAQVFPLEKNDYPRTRLTHSIECSAIAEELGIRALPIIKGGQRKKDGSVNDDFLRSCYKIPTILKTAALLHDMGNPPFGHFGENIIQDWFKKQFQVIKQQGKRKDSDWQKYLRKISTNTKYKSDFIHFEGNAQLFRLITSLDKVDNNNRLNLTYATLAVVLKYPTGSEDINQTILSRNKPGYFTAEESSFHEVQKKVKLGNKRHPLTFLLEAADDISYLTSDLQDAHHKKLISWKYLEEQFKKIENVCGYMQTIKSIEDEKIRFEKFHSFLRKKMIEDVIAAFEKNYEAIMKGEFEQKLIQVSDSAQIETIIREILKKKVYLDDTICCSQIMSNTILTKLLDVFIPAVLDYKPGEDRKTESNMGALNQRIFCLLSDNYRKVLDKTIENKPINSPEVIYNKILLATDYICGMTDSYAQQMYNMIVALPLNN